tara:strand:- start:2648 stop:2770 length:123 start_codon:yes stop_codon:yes gene_type:complete
MKNDRLALAIMGVLFTGSVLCGLGYKVNEGFKNKNKKIKR